MTLKPNHLKAFRTSTSTSKSTCSTVVVLLCIGLNRIFIMPVQMVGGDKEHVQFVIDNHVQYL